MGKIIAFKPRVKSTADSRTADYRHLFKKVALPQMALLVEDEVEDAIKTCGTQSPDRRFPPKDAHRSWSQ